MRRQRIGKAELANRRTPKPGLPRAELPSLAFTGQPFSKPIFKRHRFFLLFRKIRDVASNDGNKGERELEEKY